MSDQVTGVRVEAVRRVDEVLRSETPDPVAELRRMGEVLMKIADALDGLSVSDSRAVLQSVAAIHGIHLR